VAVHHFALAPVFDRQLCTACPNNTRCSTHKCLFAPREKRETRKRK
jgi:hypothetical protein